MKRTYTLFAALTVTAALAAPAAGQQRRPTTPEQRASRQLEQAEALLRSLQMPRPIAALNSVWIEELTWMEVRDAIADGKTTVIIPTGGIEQNGPYVATGKHNYVLQTACEWIARQLGDALCAPIIKLVPEGDIERPTGHMRYPGTISLRQETFEAVLTDVGSSLAQHGFDHIVYIGDSGGNQLGMANVATELDKRWRDTRVHYISEFYDNDAVEAYQENELGIVEEDEGFHDFYWLTAMQMVTDPATVRYDQRVAAGKASINGVSIVPKEQTIEVGKKLMQFRVDRTVRAIEAARTDS